jgi:radical SAM protein with 4Fe4S-binding SPASM domain
MISKNALLDYLQNGTLPKGPITVHVDVTNACNLNCITCWNHSPYVKVTDKKKAEWKKRKLSLKNFEAIIRDLSSVGVKKLIISGGGEPFMHESIYQMIAVCKEADFDVTVITNALLIDVEKLLHNAPDRLSANLCAAAAETYARVHPGTAESEFHALTAKLRLINAQVPISLVMVISNVNHREVVDMARLAGEFEDARLSFKLASLTGDTARFALSAEQKKTLLERDIPLCTSVCLDNNIRNNLDVFANQLTGSAMEYPIHETGCFAGLFYSRIYSNGDVFYCCSHIKVGNVFEIPFSLVWRSEAYNRVRRLMDEKRFYPECRTCGKFNLNFKAREILKTEGHS